MPDLGGFNSVALQVQPPNAMGTLGNIMNIARGAQELKFGTQSIEQKEIELQKMRQANYERVAVQNFLSDTGNWQTDGRIDMDKINATLPKIAPLTNPEVIGKLSDLSTAETNAISSRQKLTQDQRSIISGPLGVLGRSGVTDPAAYLRELDNVKATNPNNPDLAKLADSYSHILRQFPAGAHLPGVAVTLSQSLLDPHAQQDVLAPKAGLTSTGGAIQETITQPAVGAQPPSVSLTGRAQPITPTSGQEMGVDALNRPIIREMGTNGQISIKPPPGSDYRPLMTLPAGETPETAKPLFALRDTAQAAAASVPTQHFNNQQILSLAHEAFTGTGAGELSRLLTPAVLQGKAPGADAAAKTSQLLHFIKLQAVNNAAAQGATTDAARALVEQAVIPTSSPEQALKAITKVNDGMATATDMFNRGIRATLNNPANTKDIYAVRDFQNAWIKNMDPHIFMLMNAKKSGDDAEVKRIQEQLGAAGMKQLLVKTQNLRNLVTQGAVNVGP